MAGFLRKKQKQPEPVPTTIQSASSPSHAPLFARFASNNTQAQDVLPQKKAVSGPMTLASANRKESVLKKEKYNPNQPSQQKKNRSNTRINDSQNSLHSPYGQQTPPYGREKPLPAPGDLGKPPTFPVNYRQTDVSTSVSNGHHNSVSPPPDKRFNMNGNQSADQMDRGRAGSPTSNQGSRSNSPRTTAAESFTRLPDGTLVRMNKAARGGDRSSPMRREPLTSHQDPIPTFTNISSPLTGPSSEALNSIFDRDKNLVASKPVPPPAVMPRQHEALPAAFSAAFMAKSLRKTPSTGASRGKPLIFSAMTAADTEPPQSYPSPPMEDHDMFSKPKKRMSSVPPSSRTSVYDSPGSTYSQKTLPDETRPPNNAPNSRRFSMTSSPMASGEKPLPPTGATRRLSITPQDPRMNGSDKPLPNPEQDNARRIPIVQQDTRPSAVNGRPLEQPHVHARPQQQQPATYGIRPPQPVNGRPLPSEHPSPSVYGRELPLPPPPEQLKGPPTLQDGRRILLSEHYPVPGQPETHPPVVNGRMMSPVDQRPLSSYRISIIDPPPTAEHERPETRSPVVNGRVMSPEQRPLSSYRMSFVSANGKASPTPEQRPHTPKTQRPDSSYEDSRSSAQSNHGHRVLHKQRPTTPVSPGTPAAKKLPDHPQPPLVGVDLDDDPFAKPEGVQLLQPSSRGNSKEAIAEPAAPVTPPRQTNPLTPPTPVSPPSSRRRADEQRLDKSTLPPGISSIPVRPDRRPEPFPLDIFVSDPHLLSTLVAFLSFYDWCVLSSVSKLIRGRFFNEKALKEEVLERYLKTVGYKRWDGEKEPLVLSLVDLHDYMRGVSIPTHEYARVAADINVQLGLHPTKRDMSVVEGAMRMTAATRAYSRVVLRLRAQAEREYVLAARAKVASPPPSASRGVGSRPPSPTSLFSQSHHGHGAHATTHNRPYTPSGSGGFQSPLFRLKRAPLLRVFVPSPDGDWLSDASVLECEAELKRSGLRHLMRVGDVVWDLAVGDEGNLGRLIWDGSYLIDLDYTYSSVGDLPKYLPTLAFAPSYFHRVIRTGPASSNPVVRVDISPWGDQVAANLQLLQDRVRTETPQGAYHNVVRWVHRSSFVIRPPGSSRASSNARSQSRVRGDSPRIPIPDSPGLFIDPGWYGTIVVETEGTNECLADLQDRCGPGAFPPRAQTTVNMVKDQDAKLVYKVLREKSRPGEIWIRAVSPKDRIA